MELFDRINKRVRVEKREPIFIAKTNKALDSFFICLENGCIDSVPPCKFTKANELCHSYLNAVGGRWKGPFAMEMEELEFVSEYTFI